MKNLTAAIFLTLLFFTVSAFSEEYAVGFSQNPEYSIPVPVSVTPEEAKPVQPAVDKLLLINQKHLVLRIDLCMCLMIIIRNRFVHYS